MLKTRLGVLLESGLRVRTVLVPLVAVILYQLLGSVVPALAHVLGGVCINDSESRQIDTVTAERHKFNLSAGRKSKSAT